ncbi:MAG: hypothetical protein HC888_08940, partial [Candidatus Competibacteraceae bacterium]|nr:hypothetical protein [Candidatus Competibacteraceae bacterium]
GEGVIDPVTDLIPEIDKYSNIRLYKLDLICAPGYPDQNVQDALDAMCKVRQDCAGLIETPLLGSRAAIEQWYNGLGGGRTEKLNTYFLWLYGPYLKIRKRTFGVTDQETTTQLGDYSPLTRVLGAVCRSDALSNTKLRPPAGAVRSTITNVEGLQLDLTAQDEERLQGEEYDGVFNPVIFTIDDGYHINGNRSALRKNSNGKLTSLAYIESVRVGFAIKRQAEERSKFYFFEPNDPRLRESFESDLRGILKTLEEQRALKAGWVVDTSAAVNTVNVERQGGLVAVLEFTTTRAVRKVKIYATLTEPGQVSLTAA